MCTSLRIEVCIVDVGREKYLSLPVMLVFVINVDLERVEVFVGVIYKRTFGKVIDIRI